MKQQMAEHGQHATAGDLEVKETPERPRLTGDSASYRFGRALTWPLRRTKRLFVDLLSNGRAKKRVLYICHNHPSARPGGAEIYTLELYEAVRHSDEFEPLLLARCGPPDSIRMPPGTRLSSFGDDANQYLFFTDLAEFDFFYGTALDKSIYTKDLRKFLAACQPDIVHVQHTLFLGYDLLRLIKESLPAAPIVYTLHEYLPICHQNGQMTRTMDNENCREASPHRCHECFPDIAPEKFFLRKQFVQSLFSLVDLFLAPSQFLLERYIDWGIPRDKICFEEYGRRLLPSAAPTAEDNERPRNRIGFFGQINPFKGVDVLLKAMKILGEEGCDVHLWLHGANLDYQPEQFRNELFELLAATKQNVTVVGAYVGSDLPNLMAKIDWVVVPSIWWENSPLVIQEAFYHGRPVICSNVGAMAEKVRDGVDGLHFRVRDPLSLAHVIGHATETPQLWQTLHRGISDVYRIEDHLATLTDIYRLLIARKLRDESNGHQRALR